MAGVALVGSCEIADCSETPKALVVVDLELLDDEEVEDFTTVILALCRQHAAEELDDRP